MRGKESISIPATSPSVSQSATAQRGVFSKHSSLNQPRFITKASASSRYSSGTTANAAQREGRVGSAQSYGATTTPSNRPGHENCFADSTKNA